MGARVSVSAFGVDIGSWMSSFGVVTRSAQGFGDARVSSGAETGVGRVEASEGAAVLIVEAESGV